MDLTTMSVADMLDTIARSCDEMNTEGYDMEKAKEKIGHEQAIAMFGMASHENVMMMQQNELQAKKIEELEKNLEYFQKKCDVQEDQIIDLECDKVI